MKTLPSFITKITVALALIYATPSVYSAGTLTPKGSPHAPIAIRDHHVKVTINNGFAQTEVTQTFYNPNPIDLEAVYRFPLPESASLSEVSLMMGERTIHGEVVDRENARTIYESEKQAGNDAGLATKEGFQAFEFKVHPVVSNNETSIRIVYYQPVKIDTGIGRYLYPLEEGGTDDVAATSFWNPVNDVVEGDFSAEVILKSAWPVEQVRLPGFENETTTEKLEDGHYRIRLEKPGQALNRDLVVYYRLAQDLPGRVEVVPFRDDESGNGTFMMVVTPGIDLKPITGGADYVYVLDTSGSMSSKLHTLADGVSRVIGKMSPQDRYRVISFSDTATEITHGWVTATPENVERTITQIQRLKTRGGTNIYDGLSMAMEKLDDDRATSVVLVTDGVTNKGIVDPVKFHQLTKTHDIRIFGFLLGNSANWPLMRTICDGSGGFYTGVSNADDIIGQILQAKSKILHESLHDAEFSINGVKTFNVSGEMPNKIYRGEQLVLFGQYEKGGRAELTLKARLTGEDKTYHTTFDFPDVDTENPEIERLWALDQIERIERRANAGEMPTTESENAIRDLGLQYQLVTDETSMLVLDDASFENHGIARNNRERVTREMAAQSARASTPTPRNYRVDKAKPFTPRKAPRIPRGGQQQQQQQQQQQRQRWRSLTSIRGASYSTVLWSSDQAEYPTRSVMPPQPSIDSRFGFDKTLLFGLAILSVIIQSLPDLGEALQWRRSATVPLHVFTTLTGHFTHWSWDHLLWDVAAFVGLGFAAIRVIPGRFVFCLLLAALVIPIEIVLFQPQFETYRGLSGIDSALFGLLIAGLWRQGKPVRYLALIGFIGFFGKTVFELVSGNSLFVERSPDTFIPVGSAHVTGFICGLTSGIRVKVAAFSIFRKGSAPSSIVGRCQP